MKKFLVGYTGFVGSNLCEETKFDGLFNSKNIEEAYNQKPDLLIYSGVPAQKFMANKNPLEDFKIIEGAIQNIKKINPKKLVLISTIDVYQDSNEKDEDSVIETSDEAYGKNRRYLEEWVITHLDNYLIVRLPGLYGKNIKKNFIYDLIHFIPSMLKEEKYLELLKKEKKLDYYYTKQDNGFYKCKELTNEETIELKKIFQTIGFSALHFTDSRGTFQFYNLHNLWKHIEIALKNDIKILNLATEPVTITEIYKNIYGKDFKNEISSKIPFYNYKTKYFEFFSGKDGYIFNKEYVLQDIKQFVEEESR